MIFRETGRQWLCTDLRGTKPVCTDGWAFGKCGDGGRALGGCSGNGDSSQSRGQIGEIVGCRDSVTIDSDHSEALIIIGREVREGHPTRVDCRHRSTVNASNLGPGTGDVIVASVFGQVSSDGEIAECRDGFLVTGCNRAGSTTPSTVGTQTIVSVMKCKDAN